MRPEARRLATRSLATLAAASWLLGVTAREVPPGEPRPLAVTTEKAFWKPGRSILYPSHRYKGRWRVTVLDGGDDELLVGGDGELDGAAGQEVLLHLRVQRRYHRVHVSLRLLRHLPGTLPPCFLLDLR